MIAFRDVRFAYRAGAFGLRRREVLGGCDWRVEPGAFVALLGPSGTGKSTLVRLALGLMRPRSGSVRVAGVEPWRLSGSGRRAFAARVRWVPQHPDGAFDPRWRMGASLHEALRLLGEAGEGEAATACIATAMAAVGLAPDLLPRRPGELSGGEIQRFALARALLGEPELILLDEPTSMLDLSVQAQVMHLLLERRRRRPVTCVLVTHDEALARRVADRVDRVAGGRVVQGTTEGAAT